MVVGGYPFCDPAAPHNNRETIKRITKLQYAFPPAVRLSNELHDLIARIFVTSPQQRMSLAQIKRHPWFLKNLPPDDSGVRGGEDWLLGRGCWPVHAHHRCQHRCWDPRRRVLAAQLTLGRPCLSTGWLCQAAVHSEHGGDQEHPGRGAPQAEQGRWAVHLRRPPVRAGILYIATRR